VKFLDSFVRSRLVYSWQRFSTNESM